jgi:ParB family chromosome partitioning protein
MPPEKSRRLGRGLDALFGTATPGETGEQQDSPLRQLPISQIQPNPFQPRRNFSAAELHELEESLTSSGLLQPVTVRRAAKGKGYELVAGERRLRAASNLGWTDIAAVVKDIDDKEMLTLALVENLQRFDLNPVEEAEGFNRLIKEFGYTQQSVAQMVGRDRSTIANVIRILQLPPSVRSLLEQGSLTAGQARPLLGVDDEARMESLAKQAVTEGWSAREVERRVREVPKPAGRQRGRPRREDSRPAEVRSLEQRLRKHFQTDVAINLRSDSQGSITISFYSPDDLERVLELLGLGGSPH